MKRFAERPRIERRERRSDFARRRSGRRSVTAGEHTLGIAVNAARPESSDISAAYPDVNRLRTLGSLSLCRSLLEAGVVDRFRVVVFPVITGATGKARIFDGDPDISLDLVDSREFDGRLQLLEYVPTVLDGPPGVGDQMVYG
jgi:dihydrofolate reductase